jgi:GNAT superfamily N-acetyltransferase
VSALAELRMRVVTTLYRRVHVMACDLSTVEPIEPDVEVRIARLTRDDVEAYARFRPRAPFDDRLAKGHEIVAAWLGDRIVHAAWIATGRGPASYLDRDLVLAPDELLVYDSFTSPDHRGMAIAPARMSHVFREYRKRGYRRCLAIVAVENEGGRRAMESGGYRAIGRYACLRAGRWTWYWTWARGSDRVPDLVGHRAASGSERHAPPRYSP